MVTEWPQTRKPGGQVTSPKWVKVAHIATYEVNFSAELGLFGNTSLMLFRVA
jgi:hypothetical protein